MQAADFRRDDKQATPTLAGGPRNHESGTSGEPKVSTSLKTVAKPSSLKKG
jgi:hypothetical protein